MSNAENGNEPGRKAEPTSQPSKSSQLCRFQRDIAEPGKLVAQALNLIAEELSGNTDLLVRDDESRQGANLTIPSLP